MRIVKRILILLASVVMFSVVLVAFAYASTVPGDVNEDGTVDTADAAAVLKYLIHENELKRSAGDVNYDGFVDTADAACLLKAIINEYDLEAVPDIPGATGVMTVKNENLPFTYSAESDYYFPCPDQVYLPYGTMDYVMGEPFTIKDGNTVYTFVNTASGKRFQTKDVSISNYRFLGNNFIESVDCKVGNTAVSFDFEMTWNVPFNIQTDGVNYKKSSYSDFKVMEYNPKELTLQFDYTIGICDIKLPENDLFTDYRWVKNNSGDYGLVFTLGERVKGTGYTAEYKDGHLIISFTRPIITEEADNEYGGTLNGQVIAISAGHGGWDSGATGTHGGKAYYELDLNNALVSKLKSELEKIGATVIICNDIGSDNRPDYRARSKHSSASGAQIHIAIHQNSATASATGFECWYYSQYSYMLSKYLQNAMKAFYVNSLYGEEYKSIMDRGVAFSWYSDTVYPDSPTVLLETGFITNEKYCLEMQNEEMQNKLIKELVKGIVDYGKN